MAIVPVEKQVSRRKDTDRNANRENPSRAARAKSDRQRHPERKTDEQKVDEESPEVRAEMGYNVGTKAGIAAERRPTPHAQDRADARG
jgi:hypothetical protein